MKKDDRKIGDILTRQQYEDLDKKIDGSLAPGWSLSEMINSKNKNIERQDKNINLIKRDILSKIEKKPSKKPIKEVLTWAEYEDLLSSYCHNVDDQDHMSFSGNKNPKVSEIKEKANKLIEFYQSRIEKIKTHKKIINDALNKLT